MRGTLEKWPDVGFIVQQSPQVKLMESHSVREGEELKRIPGICSAVRGLVWDMFGSSDPLPEGRRSPPRLSWICFGSSLGKIRFSVGSTHQALTAHVCQR